MRSFQSQVTLCYNAQHRKLNDYFYPKIMIKVRFLLNSAPGLEGRGANLQNLLDYHNSMTRIIVSLRRCALQSLRLKRSYDHRGIILVVTYS